MGGRPQISLYTETRDVKDFPPDALGYPGEIVRPAGFYQQSGSVPWYGHRVNVQLHVFVGAVKHFPTDDLGYPGDIFRPAGH